MTILYLTIFTACSDKAQDSGNSQDTADTADTNIVDSGDSGDSGDDDLALSGLSFILIDSEGYQPVSQQLSLSFPSSTSFEYSGDCNSFFGDFRIENTTFVVDGIGGTEMGCSSDLATEEDWLISFFTSGPTVGFDNDDLIFQSNGIALIFGDRDTEIPDAPLLDTQWIIGGYIDGDTESAYNLSNIPNVRFDSEGSIGLDTGCNSGIGTYTLNDNDTISVTMEAYSDATCPDDSSQDAESHITSVFMGPTLSFSLNENNLVLMNGTLGLSAMAESQ